MNERYDTYLLYEYMKKISYTVRILVKLSEDVNPKLLHKAAQEAFGRFPYFAVKVRVGEGGNFVLDHNEHRLKPLADVDGTIVLG